MPRTRTSEGVVKAIINAIPPDGTVVGPMYLAKTTGIINVRSIHRWLNIIDTILKGDIEIIRDQRGRMFIRKVSRKGE